MPDFTPLPPPPGGHSDARARGRRRRTRRSLATGGALLSLAALVALSLPLGRSSAIDRLVPQPASSANGDPSASEPTASPSPVPEAAGPSASADTPAQPTSPATAAATPTAGAAEAPEPTFDRVVRSYTPPSDAFTLCSLNASVGGGQSETSLGWCHTVEVTAVGARYRLTVVVCRSSDRTAADLHPDLVPVRMRVARQDVDVWTLTVTPTPRETLPTEPGGCWRWSTDWDARGDDGRPVRTGGYELLGAAMADELPGGDQRTTFNANEP